MKILLVHPGASFSIQDVFDGIRDALHASGHTIVDYQLDARIDHAARFLRSAWRRAQVAHPEIERPNGADVLYLAGQGVLERALRHQVDWVLVVSGMYLMPDWLILLHRAGVRVAVLLTESPYDDDRQARILPHVTLAWTNERSSLPFLRRFNPHVSYLPHAFDPQRHGVAEPDESEPSHDVVFVGTCFEERAEILSGVNWDGIDLGLYGTYEILGSRHHLRRYIRASVIPNSRSVALYRRAKIGLNLYRTSMGFGRGAPRIRHAESLNPRALELAACGAFTLSDHRDEVTEVFGPLVPTFTTAAELEQLIRFYLAHDHERRRLAAGLPDAVASWTFDQRAAQIIGDLERFAAHRIQAIPA